MDELRAEGAIVDAIFLCRARGWSGDDGLFSSECFPRLRTLFPSASSLLLIPIFRLATRLHTVLFCSLLLERFAFLVTSESILPDHRFVFSLFSSRSSKTRLETTQELLLQTELVKEGAAQIGLGGGQPS